MDNITSYTKKNSATGQVVETAVYRYDDKNQLVFAGTSDTVGTAYTYDANGNILTKTNTATNATVSYGYTDPTWADLLTSYNGQTITYDEVGNPLNYRNGMTFGWGMDSRNLETITIGENVYNYSYTGEGERAAKYVGDVSYQYKFFDGVLYGESRYDMFGETLIYYFYDENGTMYGFSYNGTPYYYRLNLQGDVTGIYDSNGQLVTEYTYDEWGKVLTVTGSMADTVGQANAIRYRGYYYDAETGFYYLQTRYYDPETGRFINADGFISTGQGVLGTNMFAYCGNNPVNNADYSGNRYCAATTVKDESIEDRKAALQFQTGIAQSKASTRVEFVPDKNGNGGRIVNSYLITDSKEITEYAIYLMQESEYSSNFIGSLEGFVFEWEVHNMAYYYYNQKGDLENAERAMHVDVGRTIYEDIGHGFFGYAMLRAFEMLYPEQAQKDWLLHNIYHNQ